MPPCKNHLTNTTMLDWSVKSDILTMFGWLVRSATLQNHHHYNIMLIDIKGVTWQKHHNLLAWLVRNGTLQKPPSPYVDR